MDYSKAIGMNPKYNTFDLSHDKRMSLKMGEIIPVMAVDVLPGDKFTIESSHLTRMFPSHDLGPVIKSSQLSQTNRFGLKK